jgi:hypothetical protein
MANPFDYSEFEFTYFTDLELVEMQNRARAVADTPFVDAILKELGKRQRVALELKIEQGIENGQPAI